MESLLGCQLRDLKPIHVGSDAAVCFPLQNRYWAFKYLLYVLKMVFSTANVFSRNTVDKRTLRLDHSRRSLVARIMEDLSQEITTR